MLYPFLGLVNLAWKCYGLDLNCGFGFFNFCVICCFLCMYVGLNRVDFDLLGWLLICIIWVYGETPNCKWVPF